jgi:hypothetical protein
MNRLGEKLAFAAFLMSFAASVYVFVEVQVLQSYPFYHSGVYGDVILVGLTYIQTLEVAAPISAAAFGTWLFLRSSHRSNRSRALLALGWTLVFFGGLVAIVVYAETYLLWGNLWNGLHLWAGFPGGGGYPWGGEQLAYNLCFLRGQSYTPLTQNCYFLNYNWALGLGVVAAALGLVLAEYYRTSG